MEIKEMRTLAGMTRQEFADFFGISRRTVEKWEMGERKCTPYLQDLMEYKLKKEGLIEKKTGGKTMKEYRIISERHSVELPRRLRRDLDLAHQLGIPCSTSCCDDALVAVFPDLAAAEAAAARLAEDAVPYVDLCHKCVEWTLFAIQEHVFDLNELSSDEIAVLNDLSDLSGRADLDGFAEDHGFYGPSDADIVESVRAELLPEDGEEDE